MRTEQQTREEFAKYWESLKDAYGKGAGNKSEVWEQFISFKVEEGDVPADAITWTMPRSTKNLGTGSPT